MGLRDAFSFMVRELDVFARCNQSPLDVEGVSLSMLFSLREMIKLA